MLSSIKTKTARMLLALIVALLMAGDPVAVSNVYAGGGSGGGGGLITGG